MHACAVSSGSVKRQSFCFARKPAARPAALATTKSNGGAAMSSRWMTIVTWSQFLPTKDMSPTRYKAFTVSETWTADGRAFSAASVKDGRQVSARAFWTLPLHFMRSICSLARWTLSLTHQTIRPFANGLLTQTGKSERRSISIAKMGTGALKTSVVKRLLAATNRAVP